MANNFDRAILTGTNMAANTFMLLYFCPTTATTKTVGIGLIVRQCWHLTGVSNSGFQ